MAGAVGSGKVLRRSRIIGGDAFFFLYAEEDVGNGWFVWVFSCLFFFLWLYIWKGVILGGVILYIFIIVGHQVFIDEGSNSTWLYHGTPKTI
jgi:hypothetical protein